MDAQPVPASESRPAPDSLPAPLPTLPGTLLADEGWLAMRIDQTGRQFGCEERRTNATLWWYSASAVLLGPAVHALVRSDSVRMMGLAELRFTLGFNGYLERVIPGPELAGGLGAERVTDPAGQRVTGPGELGRHLDDVLAQVITPLSRAGRVSEQSLWAVASDSLATRVLAETAVTPAGTAQAAPLATAIAAASTRLRPLPRYVEVRGRPQARPRPYVRRGSCCLIFRVPDGLCLSCPRQTPAERLSRLQQHARIMDAGTGSDDPASTSPTT